MKFKPLEVDMERLLTLSEVSSKYGIPEATLRYWRHLGTGPKSFRVGRRVRYLAPDVDEWIETQRQADPAA